MLQKNKKQNMDEYLKKRMFRLYFISKKMIAPNNLKYSRVHIKLDFSETNGHLN